MIKTIITINSSEPIRAKLKNNYNTFMEKRYNIWLNSTNYSKDIIYVDKCRAEIGMASTAHQEAKRKFEQEMHLNLFSGLFSHM